MRQGQGLREGENPAAWRGHLDHLVAATAEADSGSSRRNAVLTDVAAFIAKLRSVKRLRHGLDFASDGSPFRAKSWGCGGLKIDSIRKSGPFQRRMKAGREHRVPCPREQPAILRQLEKVKTGDFVLPGQARTSRSIEYGHGNGFCAG
jgi:hypothetical protein